MPWSPRSVSISARAGPGDVALFAYAGHGSEEPAPLEVAHLEPTGRIQTLVLSRLRATDRRHAAPRPRRQGAAAADRRGGRQGRPRRGACSTAATPAAPPATRWSHVRGWTPDAGPTRGRRCRDLVTELARRRGRSTSSSPARWITGRRRPLRHVALSACRSFEKAKELRIGRTRRRVRSRSPSSRRWSALGPRRPTARCSPRPAPTSSGSPTTSDRSCSPRSGREATRCSSTARIVARAGVVHDDAADATAGRSTAGSCTASAARR